MNTDRNGNEFNWCQFAQFASKLFLIRVHPCPSVVQISPPGKADRAGVFNPLTHL
jgi:hypothetical protein